MKNVRTISTKLYSDIAYEALDAVIGQIADGIWENSPSMDKYWRFASVERADNKEVIIEISKEEYLRENYGYRNRYLNNAFFQMTNEQIIDWFAGKLKQIVNINIKDDSSIGKWKRDNVSYVDYLGHKCDVTVQKVYCLYEFLKGRRNRFDDAIYNEIIGTPATDDETAKAIAKRTALEIEKNKYVEQRKEVDAWEKSEIERIKKEAEAKRSTMWQAYNSTRKMIESK